VHTSVSLPLIVVTAHAWLSYSKTTFHWVEVTTAISSFAMSIGLCEGATQLLKLYVQRRRPNFYALCAFDKTLKTCTADLKHLREANFSFPSGHSSLACGGMTFLVLYFCGKLSQRPYNNSKGAQPSQRQRHLFLTAAIPWGWAIFVAASRLVDQWHHPSDVLAGLGLGFCTVNLVYHTWYPPVWSQYAGIPRPLLQELDYNGSNSSTCTHSTANKLPTLLE
jgi:diacylglycerol diphosphate phosphatase/phosphatidate phosphatase